MPIHDSDWSLQFFEGVACPADVDIPAADADAWQWNTGHRWVYDKLAVAASQGIRAAPFGVEPDSYFGSAGVPLGWRRRSVLPENLNRFNLTTRHRFIRGMLV